MTADNSSNRVEISGGKVQGFIQENRGTVNQIYIEGSELVSEPASISGRWIDPVLGHRSEITQNRDMFQFTTMGMVLGDPFRSSGNGTINGRSFDYDYDAQYQSGRQSRGHCSGTVSADGIRLTSTCTDSMLGTFLFSAVRQ